MAEANARLETSTYMGLIRSAGAPSTSPMAPPAAAAAPSAAKRSRLSLTMRLPATTAPTPTMAYWPRLTVPDHPERTTRERATTPSSRYPA